MKTLFSRLALLSVYSFQQTHSFTTVNKIPLYCSARKFTSRRIIIIMQEHHHQTNCDNNNNNNEISETLFGLLGCITNEQQQVSSNSSMIVINEDGMKSAISALNSVLSPPQQPTTTTTTSMTTEQLFVESAIKVADEFCHLATNSTLGKKQTWQALQQMAERIIQQQEESSSSSSTGNKESNALAISFVFGALALSSSDCSSSSSSKAAASAIASTVSRSKVLRQTAGSSSKNVASSVLKTFLVYSSCNDSLDLNILTHFARAFKLTNKQNDDQYSEIVAKAIQFSIIEKSDSSSNSDGSNEEEGGIDNNIMKQKVSAALALSCQIGPWPYLSPVMLVRAAIPYSLWHAAEQVCICSHKSLSAVMGGDPSEDVVLAVEVLIDAAMEERMHRLADNMATKLYEQGGKSRFIDARLHHAYDTITKVIHKRQLPIIERQVDRVDKAVEKIQKEDGLLQPTTDDTSPLLLAGKKIRKFALDKLGEGGEVASAYRLATIWNMDYIYDEETILAAAAARRKKYLQYDEVLTGTVPDLISDAGTLRTAFNHIQNDGPFGIDAEWDEDTAGASLFQISSRKDVLLLDIPALSSTKEGVQALADTVGTLLDSSEAVVVGFSPRQDLSRLRASPCTSDSPQHWMSGTRAVVDAQKLIGEAEPKLKTLGLSRACQHYFGKPLDKAEQCSLWSARPLSEGQRIYAALDAAVLCAIYEKLYPMGPPKAP